MKFTTFAIALLLSPAAFGQSVSMSVSRGACVGEPSADEAKRVEYSWLKDGSLEVLAWDTEDSEIKVVDTSALIGLTDKADLSLSYSKTTIPLAPDQGVVYCDFPVRLKFKVTGLPRANYKLHVELRQSISTTDVRL
jgi:hypothetical protein